MRVRVEDIPGGNAGLNAFCRAVTPHELAEAVEALKTLDLRLEFVRWLLRDDAEALIERAESAYHPTRTPEDEADQRGVIFDTLASAGVIQVVS